MIIIKVNVRISFITSNTRLKYLVTDPPNHTAPQESVGSSFGFY